MSPDSKTQTPRTEAMATAFHDQWLREDFGHECPPPPLAVPTDFARTLEIELSAAIKERDEWKRKAEEFLATIETRAESETEILSELERDRDAWRSLARRLAEALRKPMIRCENLHHDTLELHAAFDRCPAEVNVSEAIAAFDQMEKGTSPTSAQPPST